MPPHIEEAITKIICDFVWDNNIHPRISLEYLHRPLNNGGLNLLDIKVCNEAIELVWLRDYLNLTPSHQMWAIVSDILINMTAPQGTLPIVVINTFLQTWNPPSRGPKLVTLNKGIIRMLKVAKRYNTNLAAIRLSPGVCDDEQHRGRHTHISEEVSVKSTVSVCQVRAEREHLGHQ
jgi:hypothetical protein